MVEWACGKDHGNWLWPAGILDVICPCGVVTRLGTEMKPFFTDADCRACFSQVAHPDGTCCGIGGRTEPLNNEEFVEAIVSELEGIKASIHRTICASTREDLADALSYLILDQDRPQILIDALRKRKWE